MRGSCFAYHRHTLRWLDRPSRQDFNNLMTDVAAVSLLLAGEPEKVAKQIGLVRSRMDGLAKRAESILNLLQEVVDFFQPSVLAAVCKLANEHDNPKRRKYASGLLGITCERDRDKTTIVMPTNYAFPSQEPIRNLKLALSGARYPVSQAFYRLLGGPDTRHQSGADQKFAGGHVHRSCLVRTRRRAAGFDGCDHAGDGRRRLGQRQAVRQRAEPTYERVKQVGLAGYYRE